MQRGQKGHEQSQVEREPKVLVDVVSVSASSVRKLGPCCYGGHYRDFRDVPGRGSQDLVGERELWVQGWGGGRKGATEVA